MKWIFAAVLWLTTSTSALAVRPHLSSEQVQSLAEAAARSASYDKDSFVRYGVPLFNPVTAVWSVDFVGDAPKVDSSKKFSVFVYD
jgi:hypothetical protein